MGMPQGSATCENRRVLVRILIACALVATACSSVGDVSPALPSTSDGTTSTTERVEISPTEATEVQARAADPVALIGTEPTAPTSAPDSTLENRSITDTEFSLFATVGAVELHLPSARIELVGFHESSHDGSQQMTANIELLDRGPQWMTMETRDRGTGDRTAADIASDPDGEIRSPVTGTVLRAGGYVLYCEHQDDFLVIEPDARPGWEVKVFHIDGVQVFSGERVEAGVTVIAPGPTRLPFESQIDELAAAPAWPHVHIEVVDPSIPDRPSGGGC